MGINDTLKNDIRKRIFQVLFQLFFTGAVVFLAAGTLDWPLAWAWMGVQTLMLIFNALYLLPRNPEVIAERGQIKEGTKLWDRRLTSVAGLATLFELVVIGFDRRFYWSPGYPIGISILAMGFFCLGTMLFSWAMVSNRYFATTVRIQLERDHQVEMSGPYRFVRHPGYVGYNIFTLALPIALGSLWGLLPAIIVVFLMVVRTSLEDGTLRRELPGYLEYSKRVRYRLLPGIW